MEAAPAIPHRERTGRRPLSRSPAAKSPTAPSARAREEAAGQGATWAGGSPAEEGQAAAGGFERRPNGSGGGAAREERICGRRRSGGGGSGGRPTAERGQSFVAREARRAAARAFAPQKVSSGRRPPSPAPSPASPTDPAAADPERRRSGAAAVEGRTSGAAAAGRGCAADLEDVDSSSEVGGRGEDEGESPALSAEGGGGGGCEGRQKQWHSARPRRRFRSSELDIPYAEKRRRWARLMDRVHKYAMQGCSSNDEREEVEAAANAASHQQWMGSYPPSGMPPPDADKKGLAIIADEVKQLAQRARDNSLKPEDYEGGTFTVSNSGGPFGIKQFCAIVNPPRSAILAIGSAEKRLKLRPVLSCQPR